MFHSGENVEFRRSDGTWSFGQVRDTIGDIVTVEWISGNRRGTKSLNKLLVRPLKSYCRCGRISSIILVVFLVFICLVFDRYYHLREVRISVFILGV